MGCVQLVHEVIRAFFAPGDAVPLGVVLLPAVVALRLAFELALISRRRRAITISILFTADSTQIRTLASGVIRAG